MSATSRRVLKHDLKGYDIFRVVYDCERVVVGISFKGGGGGGVTLCQTLSSFLTRNIVGCLLKKRLTKGGSRAPRTPLATPLS